MKASPSQHELVSCLIGPRMAWWANMPEIHGMQEVWGSNPHSSTAGQSHNSKFVLVAGSLVRGGLRGTEATTRTVDLRERQMACLIARRSALAIGKRPQA